MAGGKDFEAVKVEFAQNIFDLFGLAGVNIVKVIAAIVLKCFPVLIKNLVTANMRAKEFVRKKNFGLWIVNTKSVGMAGRGFGDEFQFVTFTEIQ